MNTRTVSRATAEMRNAAMVNGALVVVGALGIVDNVVIHWILGLHRAIEGSPYTLHVEIGLVAVSTLMLAAGLLREREARRGGPG
jgi:uncharacterized membrane protein